MVLVAIMVTVGKAGEYVGERILGRGESSMPPSIYE